MTYSLNQVNKKSLQLNPTLDNILEIYREQPSLKQRSIKREIRYGCGTQRKEILTMLKGMRNFGLDLSKSE
jgi:hypothetical protein